MNLLRLLFCLCLGMSGNAQGAVMPSVAGESFTAKVVAVLDGDTVLIVREDHSQAVNLASATKRNRRAIKIRLAEIDAPEKLQDFGESSRSSLNELVSGKQVQVFTQAIDQYGRLVAHLSVNGLDVSAEQVRRGMAWEYSYFHRNQSLLILQEQARQAARGLWGAHKPIPPWQWRKQHPSDVPKQDHVATEPIFPPVCGRKKRCAEMISCDEAQVYFKQCGLKILDGDGDGVPCESLCAAQKRFVPEIKN